MELMLFYFTLAIAVSFLCSVLEAALLSITPSFIGALEHTGKSLGVRLRRLKDDIDRPLAAILSLNTAAHTIGAAGTGAEAVKVFGEVYVGVISAALTLLILFFSEIIPKTLGALFWRQLAPVLPAFLIPMIVVTWPLVKMSQGLSRLISRGAKVATVSRDELSALAELAATNGAIDKGESKIIRNLFLFSSLTARDVMTPRTVVFMLREDFTLAEVMKDVSSLRFSRIPVFGNNSDDVTGYVLKDQILLKVAEGDTTLALRDLRLDILAVPESLALPLLLERLVERREHISLVIEEHGSIAGIATIEDVIETLLGMEIVDEADTVTDMQEYARHQWQIRTRRLGLVPDSADTKEREAAIRLGLTGDVR